MVKLSAYEADLTFAAIGQAPGGCLFDLGDYIAWVDVPPEIAEPTAILDCRCPKTFWRKFDVLSQAWEKAK